MQRGERVPDHDQRRARKLRAEGRGWQEIARILRLDVKTVRKYAAELPDRLTAEATDVRRGDAE